MSLLTEWEGRTGKYLPQGHGIKDEVYQGLHVGPSKMIESQIFSCLAQPNSVNSIISILSDNQISLSSLDLHVVLIYCRTNSTCSSGARLLFPDRLVIVSDRIIIVIELIFSGINTFLALFRLILALACGSG